MTLILVNAIWPNVLRKPSFYKSIMSASKVVAEYCRAARIFHVCMIHAILFDKYDRYEYDRNVPVIAMKLYVMLEVYNATEEEIVAALEAMGLGETPYVDLLEILGEFFIQNAASIYTHLRTMARIQKN